MLEGLALIIEDIFGEGSFATALHGLSVEGGNHEYRIRVRDLTYVKMWLLKFSSSGQGGAAIDSPSGASDRKSHVPHSLMLSANKRTTLRRQCETLWDILFVFV